MRAVRQRGPHSPEGPPWKRAWTASAWLQEVQAEREELLVAERVLNRLAEADRADAETAVVASPAPARVAGRAVL